MLKVAKHRQKIDNIMKKIDKRELIIEDLAEKRYKEGYSRKMLVDYIKKEYKLRQTQAYAYVNEMLDEIAKTYVDTNSLEDTISFMEEMKYKCVSKNNTKEALAWQQELNKIRQLYTQKIDITSDNEPIKININLGD